MNLPLVREIADTFDARLVDLRNRPAATGPPTHDTETDPDTPDPDHEESDDV